MQQPIQEWLATLGQGQTWETALAVVADPATKWDTIAETTELLRRTYVLTHQIGFTRLGAIRFTRYGIGHPPADRDRIRLGYVLCCLLFTSDMESRDTGDQVLRIHDQLIRPRHVPILTSDSGAADLLLISATVPPRENVVADSLLSLLAAATQGTGARPANRRRCPCCTMRPVDPSQTFCNSTCARMF